MKFPKELSKERLSLLSPEDRKIYEQEHSQKKMHTIFEDIDKEYAEMYGNEEPQKLYEFDEDAFIEEEMHRIYDEMFFDIMSEDEFFGSANQLNDEFKKASEEDSDSQSLNEGAEGLDSGAWIRGLNLGWLGKLAMAGLAGLATGIYALLVTGKDLLAISRLKTYMNRLVEIMDQGIKKKRSFLTSILPKSWSKWRGERNLACFRSIQEMADRSMTNMVMNGAHKLGFFAPGKMMQIQSGDTPQPGGGLDDFKKNILGKISIIIPEPKESRYKSPEYENDKTININ